MGRGRPYLRSEGPIAFAHRGGAALFPENTLYAFEGAVRLGVRWIETDVHLSRDGVVVVFHDDVLDRTTEASGPVRARTVAELRALDAAYRFSPDGVSFPERGRGHRIPTFEEALVRFPEVRFNVELKHGGPLVPAFWELLAKHDAFDRVLVAAASDAVGREWRALAGDRCATSPGFAGVLAFWAGARLGMPPRLAHDALQVPHRHGVLTVVERGFVEAAHWRGLAVHVWTIDDPAEMRGLLDLGVDGLMSDRPDVLLDVLATRPR